MISEIDKNEIPPSISNNIYIELYKELKKNIEITYKFKISEQCKYIFNTLTDFIDYCFDSTNDVLFDKIGIKNNLNKFIEIHNYLKYTFDLREKQLRNLGFLTKLECRNLYRKYLKEDELFDFNITSIFDVVNPNYIYKIQNDYKIVCFEVFDKNDILDGLSEYYDLEFFSIKNTDVSLEYEYLQENIDELFLLFERIQNTPIKDYNKNLKEEYYKKRKFVKKALYKKYEYYLTKNYLTTKLIINKYSSECKNFSELINVIEILEKNNKYIECEYLKENENDLYIHRYKMFLKSDFENIFYNS